MTRLLHVIPEDGLGGAEIAARRAAEAEPYRVAVAALTTGPAGPRPDNVLYLGARNPLSPFAALKVARLARDRDVAVFSLWRTTLALVATRLLAPRTKVVLFLHSDRRVHAADAALTWLAARVAHQVWGDSRKTIDGLAGTAPAGLRWRVISFVLNRAEGLRRSQPRPRFIYWGRLNPLKRLDRVVSLFARVAAERSDATLTLVGPDAGSEAALRAQVAELSLQGRVTFTGCLDRDGIVALAADHDIFLQLSDQEGAAMSLIEAMQLGLVPVVTPVGEMGAYVGHGDTGLIYTDETGAAEDIGRLLDDPALFARLSAAAVDRWAATRLYQEDVMAAADALVRPQRD